MCRFPITMKSVDAFGCNVVQSVPCGRCIECLKDKQNSWKVRLIEEARDHLYVYFFTLTYRDDSVPHIFHNGEQVNHVCKTDVQKWLKRNRISYQRYFKRDIDFKYFICSEYGPNTGRPHYHGIIFTDVSPTFISSMFYDWTNSFGFVNFSQVGVKDGRCVSKTSLSAVGNYVAKYCLKPAQFRSDVEIRLAELFDNSVIPKPWYIMSKGIGSSYVEHMKRFHVPYVKNPVERVSLVVDRMVYRDGAYCYKLPRYYKDRLYRKKFPCDARVWNQKLKKYEDKTVYRFKSKNMLSLQMQVEIRGRILAEYHRKFAEFKQQYPSKSDREIDLLIASAEDFTSKARYLDTASKMSRFYNSERFRNRSF